MWSVDQNLQVILAKQKEFVDELEQLKENYKMVRYCDARALSLIHILAVLTI